MTAADSAPDDPLSLALAREDGAWAREHLDRDVVAWVTTIAPHGRVG